jgi:glycosyltransferase involved in cell wall biosynthesis
MDDAENIEKLLFSLGSQTYPNIEIIYVTEGDRELESLVKSNMQRKRFRGAVFHSSEPMSLGLARNQGAKKANGDYLAFFDDDVILPRDYIELAWRVLDSNKRFAGVTGHAFPSPVKGAIIWLPRFLHWDISCTSWYNTNYTVKTRNVWGHGMVFKTEFFRKAGGFPPSGFQLGIRSMIQVGEDIFLSRNIGKIEGAIIIFDPRLVLLHEIDPKRLRFDALIRRSIWVGRTRRKIRRLFDEPASHEKLALTSFLRPSGGRNRLSVLRPISVIGSCVVILSLMIGLTLD